MGDLPFLVDADDAIEYHNSRSSLTDAEKAYVVAVLSREGFSNKAIREALNIDKVYTVTHLKRAGTCLSESELALWHKNPTRITLGHVRAITKFQQSKREELLRNLLTTRIPVHRYEAIAQGKSDNRDTDIKRFERIMGEVIGRQIRIKFNPAKLSGSLTLDFFDLDDLDYLAKSLGFESEKHI
jgi:ParB family transcriptional regulator, chromosome partitioning protein